MYKYEILLMTYPNLDEKTRLDTILKFENILNGQIVKKEDWGLKPLAYSIKHNEQAYYTLYYLETEPDNIQKFKSLALIDKAILRFFILRHEKKWPFEMKTSKDLKFPERKNIRKTDRPSGPNSNLEKRPIKASFK